MLENLDKIPWETLEHAYGEAADVPGLIRKLASKDIKEREDALWHLYGNIWHQGTVYEATSSAVPFLIELLENPVPDKDKILVYLSNLASGYSYLDVHQNMSFYDERRDKEEFKKQLLKEHEWVIKSHEAVLKGCPVYRKLLQDEEPSVRAASAYLLGIFPEKADENLPVLKSHINNEVNEMVLAACVFSAGLLSGKKDEDWLKEILNSPSPFSVCIAAAMGLARVIPEHMPGEGLELLIEGTVNPGNAKDIFKKFPWDDSDVQTYCCELLAITGKKSEKVLPALIKAMDDVTPYESWSIVNAILHLVFNGKALEKNMTAEELSKEQKEALTAIAKSKKFWKGFDKGTMVCNVMEIMKSFGLPQRPEKLQAFLEGKISQKDKEWNI
ncbi:MAG: hypothetical protein ABRQ37_05390 [Candidatus Eremiobacterota bacterium]